MNVTDFKKNYRRRFPFRLAATSFTYPAGYADNVEWLGPFFDAIELLFFEGADPRALPDADEMDRLAALAERFDLTYNVHLPIDISLTDPDPEKKERALERMIQAVKRAVVLSPESFTLHLPIADIPLDPLQKSLWRSRALSAVSALVSKTGIEPASLCVENLEDPLLEAAPVIDYLNLSTCIDVGHLLHHGHDLDTVFLRWLPRTRMVHLHGVQGKKDHQGLDALAPDLLLKILSWLAGFDGILAIEVFSLEKLLRSLDAFETAWDALQKER